MDENEIIKLNEIKNLIEFYFSDSNLRKDKYLLNLIQNDNGCINLSKILEFKKISSIINQLPNESIKKEQILYIFKQLENKLIIFNENENENDFKIKRIEWPIKELTLLEINEIDEKTIYIEPILTNTTTDSLKQLLLSSQSSSLNNNQDDNNNNNIIQHISIPRFPDKTLKGFAFIEFSNKEISNEILLNINNNPIKYNNLIALSKIEWLEKKKKYSYLNNQSRFLKISNIPIFINNNYTSSSSSSSKNDDDDEMKVIDTTTTTTTTTTSSSLTPIKMNKPYLWKFFDENTNISVTFLDYIGGSDKAILKFSSQMDIQYAIDQFQLGEIKLYDNIITIDHLSDDEINKLKQRSQNHEKSKIFSNSNNNNNNNNTTTTNNSSNSNYKKSNYNNNSNNNNNNYNNYNKRKRD